MIAIYPSRIVLEAYVFFIGFMGCSDRYFINFQDKSSSVSRSGCWQTEAVSIFRHLGKARQSTDCSSSDVIGMLVRGVALLAQRPCMIHQQDHSLISGFRQLLTCRRSCTSQSWKNLAASQSTIQEVGNMLSNQCDLHNTVN